MSKMSKTAGLLFTAAVSVYYGQGALAGPAKSVNMGNGGKSPSTDVRLLEDLTPAPAAPGAQPGKGDKPAAGDPAATNPDGKVDGKVDPKTEGRSVSKSEVNVSDEGSVEIHVNDASLVEVLRMLSLQSQKNILCSKEVRGTVTANLYNVTIREALDQILHMNGYAYREKGNFINVYTVKELQTIEDAERKTTSEVFKLHWTPAANALNMIKPVLSQAGQVSATTPAQAGIASGGGDVGGDSHATADMLVVTDFPENLEKVRKILKDVDSRPQQVMIEAVILRAALSEDNALGVDFNILAGVKFADFLGSAGQVTGANLPSGAGAVAGAKSGLGSFGTGNSFTSSVPGGMKVGFVSDNVSVFLAALEGVTDTVVMANPKILALNKQKGEVIVGRKDGYLTTTVTQSATVQTVEFLDTGTKLLFRPFIGDDGYVRMELHPEDSSGGLTSANLPFKITTEMTSNIMVKDGHTIVIGGLFRESTSTAKSQVPFLGNLPFAGALFRNQRDQTSREEIIILLTPHVIKDDSAYAQVSEEELRKAEKLRVGVRKGMMPWGRERLAEANYEKALAEMNGATPNNQKALWYLDCATNLNPKFIEAIDLKQRVTGKEVSSVDNSSIRTFVTRAILADKGVPAAPAPGTKTDDKTPAAKPNNPSAGGPPAESTGPEAVAQGEPGEIPLDLVPDSDQILVDPAEEASGNSKPAQEAPKPVAVAPATRPSAKPEQTASKPENTPAKAEPAPVKSEAAAAKPKDQPTSEKKPAATPQVIVTELPIEEVKPDAPATDQSK